MSGSVRHLIRGGSGVWNPVTQCWENVDIYWEEGFCLDDEWLDENCFIRRTPHTLWRQVSCLKPDRDGQLVLHERSRESMQSYLVAERWCKTEQGDARIEPSSDTHPQFEDWIIDGEYWKSRD